MSEASFTRIPLCPFNAGSAVGGTPAFVGREDLMKRFVRTLASKDQLLVIRGQRRIGKTSILDQLVCTLPTQGYAVVKLDLQDKAAGSMARVLEPLARSLAGTLHAEPPLFDEDEHAFGAWLEAGLHRLRAHRLALLFDESRQVHRRLPHALARSMVTARHSPSGRSRS